jgi:arsenical pump membrane protein
VKLAIVGAGLLACGIVAALTGILPPEMIGSIFDRVWPILLFVVAITVVAELAATAGLFDVIASFLGRISRGRTWTLWLLVVAMAVVSTAFLSLDTTAVLLTPVVVGVARANGLPPLPFALATVWLANTASLALPVSNLTNLLAEHRLDSPGPLAFIQLMGWSALIAIVVTVAILALVSRRSLAGRFEPAPPPAIADRGLLIFSACVVGILLPLLVSGIPPWMPASVAAIVLIAVFLWRAPRTVRPTLLPWQLVVFASGLFLTVGALQSLGADAVIAAVAGHGDDLVSLWRLAGTALVGANAIDNLPAYLALENVADSPARLGALLVGVNAGSLITPWASLATLLWHQRLEAVGVTISWGRYALLGLCAAPVIVFLAVIPLAF